MPKSLTHHDTQHSDATVTWTLHYILDCELYKSQSMMMKGQRQSPVKPFIPGS